MSYLHNVTTQTKIIKLNICKWRRIWKTRCPNFAHWKCRKLLSSSSSSSYHPINHHTMIMDMSRKRLQ